MTTINAKDLDHRILNETIKNSDDDIMITNCLGQRFIGSGLKNKTILINGVPGNALGSYLNGADITVYGNAQDAVGDTMNDGRIVVHGNIGDAAGYAMRGGKILVKGNAGYRAGIHMKEYKDKIPVMIIGGTCGSFLGEYQAGGIIIVLGINNENQEIVSNYSCTGMHGGKLILRSECKNIHFPENVNIHKATAEELSQIDKYIDEFCTEFDYNKDIIMNTTFTIVTPDSKNPYKQMYVMN